MKQMAANWFRGTPEVGSSMKIIEGFATSSTAMVRRFRCSTLSPDSPGLMKRVQVSGFTHIDYGVV